MTDDETESYVVNVQAAVYRDDAYLLVERAADEDHAAGEVGLPGGKVEGVANADDVLERTARREVREETGVEVDPGLHYLHSGAFRADDGARVVNVVFLARHASGTARVADPAEVAGVEWLPAAGIGGRADLASWTVGYLDLAEERRRDLAW